LRLSVIVQVSSFNSGCGSEAMVKARRRQTWMSRTCQRGPVEPVERRAEVVEHSCKAAVQGSATTDQHIITVRSHRHDIDALDQFAKPAAYAVTLGRSTVLLGHGKADPNRTAIVTEAMLHHEGRAVDPRPIGNGEEVRPLP
jgi:hypothetical protein